MDCGRPEESPAKGRLLFASSLTEYLPTRRMQIWNHLDLNVTPGRCTGDDGGQQVLLESDTVQVAFSSEYRIQLAEIQKVEECKTIQLRISACFHILIWSF